MSRLTVLAFALRRGAQEEVARCARQHMRLRRHRVDAFTIPPTPSSSTVQRACA